MTLPAMTFSLTAASRKPSGAMIRTRPARDVGLVDDAAHAGEVVDVAVGVDHRRAPGGRRGARRTSSSAARAVSAEVSGSITIQPVSPSMKVMFERSRPRTW